MIELVVDGSNAMTLNDNGTIDVKDKEKLGDVVNYDNLPGFVNIEG